MPNDVTEIEQKVGGGAFASIGTVPHDPGAWLYTFVTPRLTDLGVYDWQIVPGLGIVTAQFMGVNAYP